MSPADLPPSREFLRREYVGRINRVIDFIEEHIDAPLNLRMLARQAAVRRFADEGMQGSASESRA